MARKPSRKRKAKAKKARCETKKPARGSAKRTTAAGKSKKATSRKPSAKQCAPAKPKKSKRKPAAKKKAPPKHAAPKLPTLPPDTPVPGLPPQVATPPAPSPGGGPPTEPPPTNPPPTDPPPTDPPPTEPPPRGIDRYSGPFGVREAERLLWRAGFGPLRGQAAQLAALGLDGAVAALTRVSGPATLRGPEPRTELPEPIDPNRFPYDHIVWLDRMVRSDQPFIERLALLFHDWFGVSDEVVGSWPLMRDHMELFRQSGRGSFRDLLLAVTGDGAMLVRLDGDDNQKGRPNENYARELMELYALGPDRGAYTERDVREAARGLTGYASSYHPDRGYEDFRFEPARHDEGQKELFGVEDDHLPEDVVDACVAHPLHPSFFVLKLWSAFVAAPPPDDQRRALERLYRESDHAVLPVIEAILKHPAVYAGPTLVKQPAVYAAGMLRATGRGIESIGWPEYGRQAGQRLFEPPNIAGWREDRWLDTATWRARWQLAYLALKGHQLGADDGYPAVESPEAAVAMALRYWDDPPLRDETVAVLVETAERLGRIIDTTSDGARNARRQDVLRHLVITSPDCQVS
jgi:hypothetical protein